MKRLEAVLLAMVLIGKSACAQSSLEMLQKDLDQIRQEHQDATTKNLQYFFTSLQTAEGAPEAADKLYVAAGGKPPGMAKVITEHEHETPSEESARTAVDKASLSAFDGAIQLQCGLMRFGALFITQPKLANLPEEWVAWLKDAGQMYPQVAAMVADPRLAAPPDADVNPRDGHGKKGRPEIPPGVDVSAAIRNMPLHDSPISSFLGFHGWEGKDQGNWRVADIPRLYRENVLDPLRKTPTAATLAAWDIYIAMMNADQPNADQWNDIDYPALQFEKECDDFAGTPNTEKLEALVNFIKAHPDHPKFDDWIDRVHDMIKGYHDQRTAAAAPAPASTLPPIQPDQPPPPPVSPTR